MTSLYQIGEDYARALDFDIDSEQDADALTALLGEIADRFEVKAANVTAYMRNIEAEAEAHAKEAQRHSDIARALTKRYAALKTYLEIEMRRCNMTECKAGLDKLKFVKNPWAVEISPDATIPEEFLRRKPAPPPEPDKPKLREALEAGRQIEGIRLVQTERLKIS